MLISFGIVFLTNLKNGNEINGPKVKSDRLLGSLRPKSSIDMSRCVQSTIIRGMSPQWWNASTFGLGVNHSRKRLERKRELAAASRPPRALPKHRPRREK